MKRPYVLVFSTVTIDGRIASSTGYSILSCPYDKARLLLLRGYSDAVMVGASTVLIDDPGLRKRLEPRGERYYRVVVDGRLRIAERPELRVLREREPRTIVFTAANGERVEKLRGMGVDVHVVPSGEPGRVDLGEALRILAEEYGVRRLLVEGGGVLTYSLLSERLVDELRVTVTPYVFAAGRSVVDDPGGMGFPDRDRGPRLELLCTELCPCGNCVHIAYRVVDRRGEPLASSHSPQCLSNKLREVLAGAGQG